MRDIVGYEGLYAVTSCGKVWSYRRQKFLSPSSDKDGYLRVTLSKDGKQKYFYVHRLVAEAFVLNPLGLPEVNHKSEIKTENFINNLEWMFHKDNCNYGTRNKRQAEKIKKAIYCKELDRIFASATDAAKELGINRSSLSNCLRGAYKTAGGYHWSYKESE